MTPHEIEAVTWAAAAAVGLLALTFFAWLSRRQQRRDGDRDYSTHRREVH